MNQSAIKADVAVSALRGLAAAGYFTPDQLSAMEDVLAGKKAQASSGGKHWLSISEACKHIKVSRTTLWKYCQAGNFVIHNLGRRKLIEQGELDAFILAGQKMIGNSPQQREDASNGKTRSSQ